VIIVTALAICAGCSSVASSKRVAQPSSDAAGPYVVPEHDEVMTSSQRWLLASRAINVLLSEPAGAGRVPVVIYLPGLGESSSGGAVWRGAWSAAGYAVLSVQPLAADEQAWRSELARNGEFRALAAERYAATATRERLGALHEVVNEALRRSRAGEAGWNRIDWSRVVIAGFDLGAYSVVAAAGSTPHREGSPLGPIQLRAVIALSPYASVPAPGSQADVVSIELPLLALTGDADGDPLGVVVTGAPSDRPLDPLRGPDQYLLLMSGLTHARLSGSAVVDKAAESQAGHSAGNANSDGGEQRGGRSTKGRRQGPGRAESGSSGSDRGRGPDGGLSVATARARMAQAVLVTNAFLDAYARDDARARQWLALSGPAWLGGAGELRRAQVASPGG
jgi:dienelactone hydrolase